MAFLLNLGFPNLNPAEATHLDKPLVINELIKSIQLMQSNKTPGFHGYLSEFYKKNHSETCPFIACYVRWISSKWLPSS